MSFIVGDAKSAVNRCEGFHDENQAKFRSETLTWLLVFKHEKIFENFSRFLRFRENFRLQNDFLNNYFGVSACRY